MFSRRKKETGPNSDKNSDVSSTASASSSSKVMNGRDTKSARTKSPPMNSNSSRGASGNGAVVSSARANPTSSSSNNNGNNSGSRGASARDAREVSRDVSARDALPASASRDRDVNSLSKSMDKMKLSESQHSNLSSASLVEDEKSKDKRTKSKHSISYAAERVIGSGSFGVVYQATVIETGETVAIKKVLQDRRFKNRELQIMRMLDHPNVVALKHSFYAKGEQPDDVYLNLVMEFIPETVHRSLRNHTKARKLIPIMYTKVYIYQVCRALAYIHSTGICHRDIKPQNLLLDPNTHVVKLCDFGSAKVLTKGQPNVSYICSRYYRAPELVFEATEYTTCIDIWSLGCVMGELLLGKPLFPGESGVDQLIEIIKILGTPTKEDILAMNPNHTSFSFPQITAHPWHKVFRGKAPQNAIDLVSGFLQYKPNMRTDPFDALGHEFFDDLRVPGARLPNGKPLPNLFNFTQTELEMMDRRGMTEKLIPPHARGQVRLPQRVASPPLSPSSEMSAPVDVRKITDKR